MRLSTALASLGATLLFAAAQSTTTTSTTTDVYYPTILSAAGNVTGLPGGNERCGKQQRVRKPWGALRSTERELYLEATQMAMADGGVAEFAAIAADSLSQAQGDYSCAFFSWHRRLVLAYESYLRQLDDRFACLTLPYYDVHTAYIQAVTGQCANMFECSSIFDALGGRVHSTRKETSTFFNNVTATGFAVTGAPYDNLCHVGSVHNCSNIVRNNVSSTNVPSGASFSTFQSVVATSGDYATFLQGIQYGVHNEVVDAIGGTLATAAAAHDVLYYSWYSALDMYLHVYHLCRIGVPVTSAEVVESLEVFANLTQTCGGVNGVDAASALIMRTRVDGDLVDVAQHPTLGQYFGYVGSDNWNYADIQQLGDYSYTYQLPEVLRQQILSNNDMCPGFNRAFAATYTTLSATAVKSTLRTRTTTKTTTTKTTKIVDGKKVTTTRVTKVTTKGNSTSSVPTAKSTSTNGQLVSRYNYSYLGNFSSDNVAFGEGTIVSNGYTGYTAYYGNGVITTKHNGIVSANYTSGSPVLPSASTTSARMDAAYSSMSNVIVNVKVGRSSMARNVTASVATSGSYWTWLQTAYNGLYTRFEGNVDLVATHMKLLECYTFDSTYGLSNLTSTFVANKHLVTNRVECSQRLDLVRSGLLQLAVRSTTYSTKSLRFASSTVIDTIRMSYKRVITRNVTYIRRSYTQRVQRDLDRAQQAMNNITVMSTSGLGGDETSSVVVDTGYIASNSNMMQKSSSNAGAVTTTSSSTTTTTTAANLSDTLSKASSRSTNRDVNSAVDGGTTTNTSKMTSTTPDATPVAMMPGAVPATTTPDKNPAPVMPGAPPTPLTPDANPVHMMHGATPAPTKLAPKIPDAAPAPMISGAAPAPKMPYAAPAPKMPDAAPAPMMSGATPAPTKLAPKIPDAAPAPKMPDAAPAPKMPDAAPAPMISGAAPAPMMSGAAPAPKMPYAAPVPKMPDAAPAPMMSGATPAPTKLAPKIPDAAPAPKMPDAALAPYAAPAPKMPGATPAPTKLAPKIPDAAPGRMMPGATPAPTTLAPKIPGATPAPTTTQPETCVDVSVVGDATYCIEGPICGGSGDLPNGSMCPVKGDIAAQDCHETLASYTNSSTCIAPENAVCVKINTGAWGCAFEMEFATPGPTTMTDMRASGPTTSEMEKPATAPTTAGQVTKASSSTETTVGSNPKKMPASSYHGEDYTIEQQPSNQMLSTSLAATKTSSGNSKAGSSGTSGSTIAGVAAAVGAVVAVAGFAGYKMRRRPSNQDMSPSNQDVSPSSYYVQPMTPNTQSMRL